MVDRFRPGWRGTRLGEVQIMEVIFAAVAAAAALARGGDMYAAAVIGMWSSGQAGLALQRGEARGGRNGRRTLRNAPSPPPHPHAHLPAPPRPTLAAERQKPGC